MRLDRISWDTEELQCVRRKILKELGDIQTEKAYLDDFASNVQSSWQTPVGQIYDYHLQDGLKLLDKVIKSLEAQTIGLNDIYRDYSRCENDIASALNKLSV